VAGALFACIARGRGWALLTARARLAAIVDRDEELAGAGGLLAAAGHLPLIAKRADVDRALRRCAAQFRVCLFTIMMLRKWRYRLQQGLCAHSKFPVTQADCSATSVPDRHAYWSKYPINRAVILHIPDAQQTRPIGAGGLSSGLALGFHNRHRCCATGFSGNSLPPVRGSVIVSACKSASHIGICDTTCQAPATGRHHNPVLSWPAVAIGNITVPSGGPAR